MTITVVDLTNFLCGVLLLLLCSGCAKRQSDFERMLTDEHACWKLESVLPKSNPQQTSAALCSKFFFNGTFRMYESKEDGFEATSPSVTGQDFDTWKYLENDRAVVIRGIRYNVIDYSPDMVKLGRGSEIYSLINRGN